VKILQLCLSPDFGGLEIFFRDYCRWWAASDRNSLYLCVQKGSRIAGELAALNLPTLTFPRKASFWPQAMSKEAARYVDEHGIDVIHMHWKYDLALAVLARRSARRPVKIVHSRHMDLPGRKHDPYHRLLYRAVDLYHTITRAVADQARAHLPLEGTRVETIYLGVAPVEEIDAAERLRVRDEFGLDYTFTVGVVGRLSEYKGQHLLIKAAQILKVNGVDIQVVIAGHAMEPHFVDHLRKMASELNVRDRVHFLGFQAEPHRLIQALDVLALTTTKETFGMVLVEAMRLGVPVIGSHAGGVPEIIDHNQTGLLFASQDASSLADQILTLYRDEALRNNLARNGREKAAMMFDRDTQNAALKDRIEQLVPAP
jgi:glycosyltransferase involved in cell wall biosynthesis